MPVPFACDLTAIPLAERAAHQALTRHLMSSATIRESDDGFELQFSPREQDAVSEFVARERLCCPFLTFVVVEAPDSRSVELSISGPTGAKEFIRAELHLLA